MVRLIIDKDNKRYNSIINERTASFFNYNYSLWSNDWDSYKDLMYTYEADNEEELLPSHVMLKDAEILYINWNKKEIYQKQSDCFTGFYIPTLFFEAKDRVFYENEESKKNSQLNNCISNLMIKDTRKEIDCFYKKDKKSIDFKLYLNKDFTEKDLIKIIKEYRTIEKNPKLISEYNLYTDIDLTNLDEEINLVKFPILSSQWKTFELNSKDILNLIKKS